MVSSGLSKSSFERIGKLTVVIFLFVIVGLAILVFAGNGIYSVHIDTLNSHYDNGKLNVDFQTYNEGSSQVKNINVKFTAIQDTGNYINNQIKLLMGDVIISKFVYVGDLNPGEKKENEVYLDISGSTKYVLYFQPFN